MKQILGYGTCVTLLALWWAPLGWTQGSGGGNNPGSSSRSVTPSRPSTTGRPSRQTIEPFRGPTFITGRVISELNRPLSEPVSVELNCGMKPVQVIQTDLGGYFTFNLGGGAQSNIDFSASNETPDSFGSSRVSLPSRFGSPLAGCELRLSVGGFRPRTLPLPHTSDIGRVDVGSILLERIGTARGAAVSVTSLLVPDEASKEFEKALKELQKNKMDAAMPHLEKAVEIYDQYAAAWNEIGRIHLFRNERAKAREAFEKSIAADANYLPPSVNLATLLIQEREWEAGVEAAGRVLALNPELGFASFLQAVGNFNLNRMDEAESSARAAEQAPHEDNPQVHALLAQIYMSKQDYVQAATHIRSYLEEAPTGPLVEQMRKDLAEIEAWLGAEAEILAEEAAAEAGP